MSPAGDGGGLDHPLDRELPPPVLGEPAVFVDERKHPDTRHWRWWTTRLGEDDRGVWLGSPAGTVHRRGDEPTRRFRGPLVTLVPPDDPWLVECYVDHPFVTTYVNIGTVPTWHDGGARVRQVDLDLDVVVRHGGVVVVEDRDEFEDHRVRLDYPDELVALAEEGTARAVAMLEVDPDHFRADRWFEHLARWQARREPTVGHGPPSPDEPDDGSPSP